MKKSTTKQDGRPAFQFYPKDWLAASDLQSCSLGARGLWMQILCLMFFSPIRGALLNTNGIQISKNALQNYIQNSYKKEIEKYLEELETAGVFSRLKNGTIISRRMYREYDISNKRRAAVGVRWGYKSDTNGDTKAIQVGGEGEGIVVKEGVVSGSGSEREKVQEKGKYSEFVFLTAKQYESLVQKLGAPKTAEMIERLNGYIGQIGEKAAAKKYVSHFHVIENWNRRDKNSGGVDGKSESSKYDGIGRKLESAAD